MIKFAVLGEDIYNQYYFEKHLYTFKYEELIRNLILKYKFEEKPYLYHSFIYFFDNFQKKYFQNENYDIILSVPISKKRYKLRGYNQSSLIAKGIAASLNIKYENNILIKTKNTQKQSLLNKELRKTNVENSYKVVNEKIIKNKNLLLIDDIYTTGSTLNECSRMLKKAGCKKITTYTLAKD